MNDLKVTLVQADLVWENAEANLSHFTSVLRDVGNTDLIVLPEMFNSGFTMNAKGVAESESGKTLAWMRAMAKDKAAVITGSIVFQEQGNYYNRLFWVEKDGSYQSYDKRHLFRMAEEDKTYAMGKTKLLTQLGDWKVCPLVCYDLRFPVWIRNKEGYDLLIFVANWPDKRAYAWKHLLIARAIENQCYVVGVNRVGMDGKQHAYSGGSVVIDPLGKCIFESPEGKENVTTVKLDRGEMEDFRKQFPAHLDADKFNII